MAIHPVHLPGLIYLVPATNLLGRLTRQAHDHPGLPTDLRQVQTDLNELRGEVPATISQPRTPGGDRSVLIYAGRYLLRLYPTRRLDAYTIASIDPLRIRDHHRLAAGCLMVHSVGWRLLFELRDVPAGSYAGWNALAAGWQSLGDELTAQLDVAPLTARQSGFLDTLDEVIDATERITQAAAQEGRFPYRRVVATSEERRSRYAVYEFQLVDERAPEEKAFVQITGEPEQRGQVIRVVGSSVIVRFDVPIDWTRIAQQGELEETPSSVVYDKQREAVALLRARQVRNPHLLAAMVEGTVHRLRPVDREPAERLDEDQLEAFRKAVAVQDLMLVRGPPGTGKTRTISQIALAGAVDGKRTLVTSHTNRAVDNVLAKLPPDVLAIRVGHEGSVTSEGEPYLLQRQVTSLRTEITNVTGRVKPGYDGIEHAAGWTTALGDRLTTLATVRSADEHACAELDAACDAVGGPTRHRVDQLVAEQRKRDRALARIRNRIVRLSRRQKRTTTRADWPLLGFLFHFLLGRRARRLATAREKGTRLHDVSVQARSEIDDAMRLLETEIQADPSVQVAQDARRQTSQARERSRAEAVTAADAARAAVVKVDTPPPVRGDTQPEDTETDLADLCTWLVDRLPLLRSRAKLLTEWHDEVSGADDQLHTELVRYADVVATTCIGSASRPELSDVDFDLALVDEAGQIGVTDVLVPLVRAKRAVLVGDPQQLPPFLDTEVERWGATRDPAVRGLLTKSAFERLAAQLPSNTVMLKQQRRMPAVIADFISATFYGGELSTKVQREHRDPLFRSPMAFVDTSRLPAGRRREVSGRDWERLGQPGYTNPAEAALLIELAEFYHRRGVDWAVIVPYRAQASKVRSGLAEGIDDRVLGLNVGTVDSFQGGERDIILYGFTRSNDRRSVGFLDSLRRANVAFSRAKNQLVLVGDLATLTVARDAGFRELAMALCEYVARRGDLRDYDEIRAWLASQHDSVDEQ